ncbi:MAG: carboxypeptidase M32 [Paenibacillaceae bacterium]
MSEHALSEFRELVKKIKSYEEALAVMYWDLRTGAPRKGVEARSEVIGTLSTEMFKLSISSEMGRYLEELTQTDHLESLDKVNRKLVLECKKEYERSVKIPTDMYQEYVVLTSQAESIWEDAKRASDYAMFQPYLEKIVAFNQKFVELWGYEGHKYNTLLDMYEPGITVAKLDEVFGELRKHTVPLVLELNHDAAQIDTSFLKLHYDVSKQKEFSLFILKELGYDFEAGRLDESEHPFATGLNPGDVRITTKFKPKDVAFALFGTIHECGHALYEQNISTNLIGTPLCTGASMGIHESQSRFWEIYIGSSLPFWQRYYGDLQRVFPEQLAGISVEQFYQAINQAQPSLIRIEADELTYNLHIMIRYELEKGLIGGDIQVADLPRLWNEKYEQYLGITPSNDAEGVLQDVHWASGAFGYFPSYSLGNMYGAQMINALRQHLPDLDTIVAQGNLEPIKLWLIEKVHQFGKLLTPEEIIHNVSGEELNPTYLITHLKNKYRRS